MCEGKGNSGDMNSGYMNSGYRNSGYRNSGDRNSGDMNSGYRNSGYRNSGDMNSGYMNSGDRNSGYFCTETPSPSFFDQPTELSWEEAAKLAPYVELPVGCEWVAEPDMSDEEKAANENYKTIGGYLKVIKLSYHEAWQQVWPTLDDETKQRFLKLPNFDAEKFLQITGVDVRATEQSPKKEIEIDGHRYVLAE